MNYWKGFKRNHFFSFVGTGPQNRLLHISARKNGKKSGSQKPPGQSQTHTNTTSRQHKEGYEKRLQLFQKTNKTTAWSSSANVKSTKPMGKSSQQPPNVSSSKDKKNFKSFRPKYIIHKEPFPEFEHAVEMPTTSVITRKPPISQNEEVEYSKPLTPDSNDKDQEATSKPKKKKKKKKKVSAQQRAEQLKKITLDEYGPLTEFDFSDETVTDIEPNEELLEEVSFEYVMNCALKEHAILSIKLKFVSKEKIFLIFSGPLSSEVEENSFDLVSVT